MRPRTEVFLYLLLWQADKLLRPTFRNLESSFESWAYRNGFLDQIHRLEARQFLERKPGDAAQAIYRLTDAGRLAALGGIDPEAEWCRPWDNVWRMVTFDLPQANANARARLRRFLKNSRFGYLQNSVWISPDPLSVVARQLSAKAQDVESLITFEARPAAGERNAAIVAGAWKFDAINQRYNECLKVLRGLPQTKPHDEASSAQLQRWAEREHWTWKEATRADPFLPNALLPPGYLGKQAWRKRTRVLARAARLIA